MIASTTKITESQNVHVDGVCNGMMFLPSDEQLSSQEFYSLFCAMNNPTLRPLSRNYFGVGNKPASALIRHRSVRLGMIVDHTDAERELSTRSFDHRIGAKRD